MLNTLAKRTTATAYACLACALALFFGSIALAGPSVEAGGRSYEINIPAQNLEGALQALALASHHKLLYRAELVSGKTSRALAGTFTTDDAVRQMLQGTGLEFDITPGSVVLIRGRGDGKPGDTRKEGPTDPTAPVFPAPMPQVTVEARRLEQRARSFVMKVTAASGFFMDEPVQLWRRPICPMVAGLPRREGQFVFDHLEAVLASIGVPTAKVGCHPNFFFIVTAEPESVLRGAWKRNWHLFGDASPTLVEQFIRTQRPVRVWYNNILSSQDGPATAAAEVPALASDPMLAESAFGGVPAVTSDGNGIRAHFVALNDLQAVIAIVDPTRVQGFEWARVADYVAMAGLTRVAPDVDLGDTPSILQLFSAANGSRPTGLSDWDRTFLKELYDIDPTLRSQRLQVSHLMVHDLQSAGP